MKKLRRRGRGDRNANDVKGTQISELSTDNQNRKSKRQSDIRRQEFYKRTNHLYTMIQESLSTNHPAKKKNKFISVLM